MENQNVHTYMKPTSVGIFGANLCWTFLVPTFVGLFWCQPLLDFFGANLCWTFLVSNVCKFLRHNYNSGLDFMFANGHGVCTW